MADDPSAAALEMHAYAQTMTKAIQAFNAAGTSLISSGAANKEVMLAVMTGEHSARMELTATQMLIHDMLGKVVKVVVLQQPALLRLFFCVFVSWFVCLIVYL